MQEKSEYTLTRKDVLSGTYRDKYGRLRNEQGKFLPEVKNDGVGNVTPEDVKEFYNKWWENKQMKELNKETFLFNEKPLKWLSDLDKEILCFILFMILGGGMAKLLEWVIGG